MLRESDSPGVLVYSELLILRLGCFYTAKTSLRLANVRNAEELLNIGTCSFSFYLTTPPSYTSRLLVTLLLRLPTLHTWAIKRPLQHILPSTFSLPHPPTKSTMLFIKRITLFKVPSQSDITLVLDAYRILRRTAVKVPPPLSPLPSLPPSSHSKKPPH